MYLTSVKIDAMCIVLVEPMVWVCSFILKEICGETTGKKCNVAEIQYKNMTYNSKTMTQMI